MSDTILLVIYLIIFLIIACIFNFTAESFDNVYADILQDKTDFQNLILYENDIMYKPGDGKIGLQKCLEECAGHCIEFGVTGNGLCFN